MDEEKTVRLEPSTKYLLLSGKISPYFIEYRITNEAVEIEKGILSSKVETIKLDKIESIEYNKEFLENLLGIGTIKITDASGDSFSIMHIENTSKIKNTISSRKNKFNKNSSISKDNKKRLLEFIKKFNNNFEEISTYLEE